MGEFFLYSLAIGLIILIWGSLFVRIDGKFGYFLYTTLLEGILNKLLVCYTLSSVIILSVGVLHSNSSLSNLTLFCLKKVPDFFCEGGINLMN